LWSPSMLCIMETSLWNSSCAADVLSCNIYTNSHQCCSYKPTCPSLRGIAQRRYCATSVRNMQHDALP
jgi:hypothetical protein